MFPHLKKFYCAGICISVDFQPFGQKTQRNMFFFHENFSGHITELGKTARTTVALVVLEEDREKSVVIDPTLYSH